MSNIESFSASFKMNEWDGIETGLNKKTISIMKDIIVNTVNDGEIEIEVDSMGVGTIDVNRSHMSEENFKNYLKFFAKRFGFSVLEVQTA